MTSHIPPTSTALVPYDPTLPHISVKAHLEASADSAVAHALEVAKFESRHLAIGGFQGSCRFGLNLPRHR